MKNFSWKEENPFAEKKISGKEILYSFIVISIPAFLFSLKNDLPHVFILTALLLALPLFMKKALPAKDRPVIYCITAGMLLTALPDLMISQDDARIGLFDILVRSTLVLPFLVYMAALGGLFASSGRINGARAALVMGGMLLCGDRFNCKDVNNIYLGFLDPLLHNYFTVYIVGICILGLFLPCFIRAGSGKEMKKKEKERYTDFPRKKLFFLLQGTSLSLFFIFVWFAAEFVQNNPAFFRSVEMYFMRMGSKGLRHRYNRGRSMLSRNVDLRAPLPPWFGQLPEQILFRAKAGFPPGLMRSGVYTYYENGRWLPYAPALANKDPALAGKKMQILDSTRRTGLLSFTTFRFAGGMEIDSTLDKEKDLPGEKRENTVELYPEALIMTRIVPMPGNTVRIDAVADSAEVSPGGILSLKHWKKDGGVTFFVREADMEAAYNIFLQKDEKNRKNVYGENLGKEDWESLTQVPPHTASALSKIISEKTKKLSAREKIAHIRKYFAENHTYSLYVPLKRRKDFFKDPVLRFLEDTKKGHCELFASATVLLCRFAGLPARYVTGFFCGEKSPSGNYYYCRFAHAWAEVYLPEEKKWITFDTAPAMEIQQNLTVRKKNIFSRAWEYIKFKGQEFFASVRRGYFAEGILNILLAVFHFILLLFTTIWGWGILVGIFLCTFIYLQKRKRAGKIKQRTAFEKLLLEKWKGFEKRFGRITGRKRPDNISLQEYYKKYPFDGLEEIVQEYEKLRFSRLEKTLKEALKAQWEKNMEKLLLFMKKEGAKKLKRK